MQWLKRTFNRIHVGLYRLTGGRVGGRLMGMDILLLTTHGRRSGKRRTTPVAYFRDENGPFVIAADAGSHRHPGWYHNLRSDPHCSLTIGGSKRAAQAQVVDGPERDRLYGAFREAAGDFAREYEAKTHRRFPVVLFSLS